MKTAMDYLRSARRCEAHLAQKIESVIDTLNTQPERTYHWLAAIEISAMLDAIEAGDLPASELCESLLADAWLELTGNHVECLVIDDDTNENGEL